MGMVRPALRTGAIKLAAGAGQNGLRFDSLARSLTIKADSAVSPIFGGKRCWAQGPASGRMIRAEIVIYDTERKQVLLLKPGAKEDRPIWIFTRENYEPIHPANHWVRAVLKKRGSARCEEI